jgi:FAD/FMN-containing dehydrogenase
LYGAEVDAGLAQAAAGSGREDAFARHARSVAGLRTAYDALPAEAPVRLAKSTSNLFRFGADASEGLDVSQFDEVLSVDPEGRTADVQGMVTYERLVDATLPHGLMPLVVPQLKTITLGGAVAGLGIESSSYRNGLPHESVRDMEILTGDGRVVLAAPDNEHAELYRAFPNSYGSLGYALRLRIDLEPVRPYVRLRHLRYDKAAECIEAMAAICFEGSYAGEPVNFVDGTVFSANEHYVTLGTFVDSAPSVSNYTGMAIYYQSLRDHQVDHLTVRDYLWRWDTDWFWCSRAFGVQRPLVRRLWPQRYRRSDVYRKLVAFERRHQIVNTIARLRGQPQQEQVVQDVEIPVAAVPKFLDVFHREVAITPIWLCPLKLRSTRAWPLYPLEPGELYVNLGFWSTVALPAGRHDGYHNRLVEETVSTLGGHKSLYSTVHYSAEEFWQRYNGPAYRRVKGTYDADGRLPDLYRKVRG